MAIKSFLKMLGMRQNSKPEVIAFRVTTANVSAVTTGTGGLDEGARQGTILKNATGDYTITLNRACRRTPVVVSAVPLTANLQVQLVSVSTSAINVKFTNNSGTATDTDFHLTLLALYHPTER